VRRFAAVAAASSASASAFGDTVRVWPLGVRISTRLDLSRIAHRER